MSFSPDLPAKWHTLCILCVSEYISSKVTCAATAERYEAQFLEALLLFVSNNRGSSNATTAALLNTCLVMIPGNRKCLHWAYEILNKTICTKLITRYSYQSLQDAKNSEGRLNLGSINVHGISEHINTYQLVNK